MTRDRRLVILAVGNLGLGIAVSLLAYTWLGIDHRIDTFVLTPLVASVLCQAVLLALWFVASGRSRVLRLVALIVGALYLEFLFPSDLREELYGLSTLTIAATTAALLLARAWGLRLVRVDHSRGGERGGAGRSTVTIRGLMLLIVVVAVITALARAMHEGPIRHLHDMTLIGIFALCFVAVGLLSIWVSMGVDRPLAAVAVVPVVSAGLGVFFAYAVDAPGDGWILILSIMLLYPALLLGSLMVVRSCGYRFARPVVIAS